MFVKFDENRRDSFFNGVASLVVSLTAKEHNHRVAGLGFLCKLLQARNDVC